MPPKKIKLLVVGESGVGKTWQVASPSSVNMYCAYLSAYYNSFISLFGTLNYKGSLCKFIIIFEFVSISLS